MGGGFLKRWESRALLLFFGFRNDSLKYLTGKTLAEIAKMRGTSPEETAMDLVVQDGSRVGTVYFLMSAIGFVLYYICSSNADNWSGYLII